MRECIAYYNDIRNRNAPRAQTSAGLSLSSVMQSNTTWKSVHHLPTHGYQLFLVSSPTYCGVSCKSVHTFYAMLLIDKNHNHPWKIENKSDILLTDTNSCIVAFHPIPPIYFYVSDPSIHPPSKYHYANCLNYGYKFKIHFQDDSSWCVTPCDTWSWHWLSSWTLLPKDSWPYRGRCRQCLQVGHVTTSKPNTYI